jgi:hypothetical protein
MPADSVADARCSMPPVVLSPDPVSVPGANVTATDSELA